LRARIENEVDGRVAGTDIFNVDGIEEPLTEIVPPGWLWCADLEGIAPVDV